MRIWNPIDFQCQRSRSQGLIFRRGDMPRFALPLLTSILSAIKTRRQSYYDTNYAGCDVTQIWILKNSQDMLRVHTIKVLLLTIALKHSTSLHNYSPLKTKRLK
jgi:hypothetical protein